MNTLRNNATGATYNFQSQPSGPALDYSSAPIEIGGQKGYRLKNDPLTAVLADGSMVRMGVDAAATRARMKEDLDIKRAQQALRAGELNIQSQEALLNSGGKNAPPGYRYTPSGTLEPIPGGPAALGKALPSTGVKELAAAGSAVESNERLKNSFKDEFGGNVIFGDMVNAYKRIVGDETGQAQWWQDMDMLQNQTRNQLFGSALTATELAAWEKTSVNPNMNPQQIRQNLTRRAEIEARAASKLGRAYSTAGYNKDQISELLGTASQYLDQAAELPNPVGGNPAANAPKVGEVRKGYRYKGGDPSSQSSWEPQ